jgi:hypothetical protein
MGISSSKKVWGLIIFLAILTVAILAIVIVNKTKKSSEVVPQGQESPLPTEAPKEQKSLKDLLLAGGGQQCSFKNERSSGVVYIGTGMMRGDITTEVSGTSLISHMVVDNKTSYVWVDGQTTGFKVNIDPNAQTPTASGQQGVDINQKVDYNCNPWSVDALQFNLPKGVTFNELPQLKSQTSTSSASQSGKLSCSVCDKLPASSQAQCKAALGCK